MRAVKQSTARNVMVLMVSSTDHVTGSPGLSLTITASQDGGAFNSITPVVTERGSGWYSLALTSTHTNTLGDLAVHVTGAAADPADFVLQVVAYDFADAVRLGLTALPNVASGAAGSILTAGSGAAQINPSGGKVPSTLASGDVTGNLPSDAKSINASATAAAILAIMHDAYENGTALAGGASSITLRSAASSINDYFKDQVMFLTAGAGAGQTNRINAYNGTSKVATMGTPWVVPPDNTTKYVVLGRIG